MKRIKYGKISAAIVGLLLLPLFLVLPCSAAVTGEDAFFTLPEEYAEMLDALPDALLSSLPEDLFSTDPTEQQTAWEHFLSPSALLTYLVEVVLGDITVPLSLVFSIGGILLLRALVQQLSSKLDGGLATSFGVLCRCCFCLILLEQTFTVLQRLTSYFSMLRQLNEAYLPLMGAMYYVGGNMATATVNQSTLLFSTALVNILGGESVVPLFSVCMALTVGGLWGNETGARLQVVGGKLKKWYTGALALTMLLLSGILAAQSALTAKADSLGFRAVRFVVASHIPLIGSGISEMLRSAAVGVSWLRSLVGLGGIFLLLALLLPTVGQVMLCRWVCLLGSDLAAWLGCPEEGGLLSEIGSMYGYLVAVAALCCMTFFFSLVILMRCAAAI